MIELLQVALAVLEQMVSLALTVKLGAVANAVDQVVLVKLDLKARPAVQE